MCKTSVHSGLGFYTLDQESFYTFFSMQREGHECVRVPLHNDQVVTPKVGKAFTPYFLCKGKAMNV